jgi:hypothetical protein
LSLSSPKQARGFSGALAFERASTEHDVLTDCHIFESVESNAANGGRS